GCSCARRGRLQERPPVDAGFLLVIHRILLGTRSQMDRVRVYHCDFPPERRSSMTNKIMPLADAVARFVRDGQTIAMEGFTHLIPFAAGHEVIRQGRKDLKLIRMTPDILYDQLIGMGCAKGLVFSWGGNPGVGSIHRFRDAIENGWPHALAIEEHSH